MSVFLYKVQYLLKENAEQLEKIGELEVARKENYTTLAKVDRRISELEPAYNRAPWLDPRHPEDQRGMGSLTMLRSNIERSLREQEHQIRVCYSNIEFNKAEIEQLQKESL